jgi:hypothetical protein
MGQPLSSGVSSVSPRARHWQPALGVLVAFAGGIAAAVAFQVPIGDSASLPLICYGGIVLVASLTGGALFRSRWAALAVSGALMLGIVTYTALVDALYDLAHANAGVGLVVGADIEALAIIVVWAGVPAAALSALASALRRQERCRECFKWTMARSSAPERWMPGHIGAE